MRQAQALWITGPEQVEVRDVVPDLQPDHVTVRTLFSGISRGTERLVYRGQVPVSEHDTMRAPFQEGAFTFPVKYGYAAVGETETGPRAGETVFALFPHQTRFAIPDEATVPVPTDVPAARAVLAANMETALNITWDAGISIGDRVVVIGCGVVGALVGYLAARIVGTEVTLADIDPAKRDLAEALGCAFALPGEVEEGADIVVHASASSAGLATAIDMAGIEAKIVEASWYGTQSVETPLGGRFHQRRLQLISSQVGRIPANHAARWTYRRRLGKALSLLTDPCLDALISGETVFDKLTADYGDILNDPTTLCHRIRY
ncbi:zinc-binding alcohol dehydrogenase [Cognatiyoonia sp. IB215446]|uniref:zinc-dependent alcohol dehydrogenase n=1 Tax=Cognatiyoonia sp. IB215446 TaxID=3097355 RepID=UPI002A178A31|nr:zinc-binding alcohol dehydrogenase [Cognatiyoonia sp. IB215446]MDX8349427.1 zinc-binding alcohol dehydrogenase [Cognatiyoonia sp. IB215446]